MLQEENHPPIQYLKVDNYRLKIEQSIYTGRGGWLRGPMLGKGGFGSVYIAFFINPRPLFKGFPEVLAVKSADIFSSAELVKEKIILDNLGPSPFIIRCFGGDITIADSAGRRLLNVFLEFAPGRSLADLIEESPGFGLLESQVKQHTRSILGGLEFVHRKGYVHCDIKPENILLVAGRDVFVAKIADFGLAKRAVPGEKEPVRGTTRYLPPEAVKDGIQEKSADVWALGCVVLVMLTGESVWDNTLRKEEIMHKIATETPVLPSGISKEAKDFLLKCFTRDPKDRPSAAMLLCHPFVRLI